MTIQTAIGVLRAIEAKSSAFKHAMGLLNFDGATTAPRGAAGARGDTLAMLSGESYQLTVSGEYREALDFLTEHSAELDRRTARKVLLLRRDFERISKIPLEEYTAYSKLINEADDVWHRAKLSGDFASFAPYLEKIIAAMKRFAGYSAPDTDPYEYYLDRYEEGLDRKTADVFFENVRRELVPVIHAVNGAPQPDDAFLSLPYPIDIQRRFTDYLMDVLCLDRAHCAIGETEHPFTTHFSKYDVRMTTHYYENHPEYSMFSVIHEGGHATYELNTGDELYLTRLATGTSMGVHESQSRFFENMIGRSQAFIKLIYPKMAELFPEQLAGISPEALYRAVNRSFPSLLRTKADELTYPLHVLIRYEIEKMLFSGDLPVKDIPEVWNGMYRDYLGIEVPDDARGCLQDMHWASGMFGYFPSYAIGSAYAAQIYAAMERDTDIPGMIRSGNLRPIVEWLTARIYRHGAALTPAEVLCSACGADFDPTFYTDYLKRKYTALYSL